MAKSRIVGKLAYDMEKQGPSGDAGVDATIDVLIKGFKEEQERLAELSRKMERAEQEQLVQIMGGISMIQQPSEPKKNQKKTVVIQEECDYNFKKDHCHICAGKNKN
jgi:hypothetical protein